MNSESRFPRDDEAPVDRFDGQLHPHSWHGAPMMA